MGKEDVNTRISHEVLAKIRAFVDEAGMTLYSVFEGAIRDFAMLETDEKRKAIQRYTKQLKLDSGELERISVRLDSEVHKLVAVMKDETRAKKQVLYGAAMREFSKKSREAKLAALQGE